MRILLLDRFATRRVFYFGWVLYDRISQMRGGFHKQRASPRVTSTPQEADDGVNGSVPKGVSRASLELHEIRK